VIEPSYPMPTWDQIEASMVVEGPSLGDACVELPRTSDGKDAAGDTTSPLGFTASAIFGFCLVILSRSFCC
jgi:hypothetical protein